MKFNTNNKINRENKIKVFPNNAIYTKNLE